MPARRDAGSSASACCASFRRSESSPTFVQSSLIGNLIPRGGVARARGWGVWGAGGRLATDVGPPLRLFPPAVRRLRPISRSHPGTPGVRGPSTGNMSAVYPLIPAVARPKSACPARVHGSQGSSGWSIASRRRCSSKSGSTSWMIPRSEAGIDRTGRDGGEGLGGARRGAAGRGAAGRAGVCSVRGSCG